MPYSTSNQHVFPNSQHETGSQSHILLVSPSNLSEILFTG